MVWGMDPILFFSNVYLFIRTPRAEKSFPNQFERPPFQTLSFYLQMDLHLGFLLCIISLSIHITTDLFEL